VIEAKDILEIDLFGEADPSMIFQLGSGARGSEQ
jgi:hypothetical protein